MTMGSQPAPCVLVVDDEPGIRGFLATLLELEGYRVRNAVDGLEALEQVATERPDVLLLDLAMPRMDGWQVLATLRSNGDTLPVVVMTADFDARQVADAHQVDGFLRKPFNVDQLLACLTRVLAEHSRLAR
jgi:two-component system response regulator MprA